MFHGFCSEKGIWEFGELELKQLFSIEKLKIFGDRQELEQGDSGGVSKGFSCWLTLG